MNALDQKIENQVNLDKPGIYEVFVNQGELRTYWNLEGSRDTNMMQKVFVSVFDGKVIGVSFERSRAIRNLLDEAGVDTLAELETIN